MKQGAQNEQQLTANDKLILSVAKIHPSANELNGLDALLALVRDWEKVCNTLIERGFAPLFYKKLPLLTNAKLVPEAVQQKLKKTYYLTLSRNSLLYEQFQAIAKAFAVAGIEVIPLKGIYLVEWLYKDYGIRQMSDIDLLVRKKEAKQALQVLDELGYKIYDDEESELVHGLPDLTHFKPRMKNNVSVELHIKVHHNNEKYKITTNQLFSHATKTTLNNGITFHALDVYDLLIHLCVHLDKHFYYQHVQFTSFIDLVNFPKIYDTNFEWETLRKRCTEYNCYDIVLKYLLFCHEYFQVYLPADIVQSKDNYLTETDKNHFIAYLNGIKFEFTKNSIERHISNLRSKSIFSLISYGFINVFPHPSFLIKRYAIKPAFLVPVYYFYRWWIGLKGLIRLLNKNIVK